MVFDRGVAVDVNKIIVSDSHTHMHKKTRCCTADLTICHKAAVNSPLCSCSSGRKGLYIGKYQNIRICCNIMMAVC
jgi:hypothetical protein